jgi:hypothetical protein
MNTSGGGEDENENEGAMAEMVKIVETAEAVKAAAKFEAGWIGCRNDRQDIYRYIFTLATLPCPSIRGKVVKADICM